MTNILRRAAVLAVAAMLLPSLAAAGGTDRYRLAGVVAVGPDYLGILELPGGDQLLVRKGSVVEGGGRVVLLDATRLRIAFPGRPPLDIALDGSPGLALVPSSLGVVQAQSDMDNVMIRSVDADAFSASVERPRDAAGKASGSGAPSKRADAATEAGRRLAPVLNLPPDSRVVAVNEQPVRSAEQAVKLIENSLRSGVSPRLNLERGGVESRVYMSPAQPEP